MEILGYCSDLFVNTIARLNAEFLQGFVQAEVVQEFCHSAKVIAVFRVLKQFPDSRRNYCCGSGVRQPPEQVTDSQRIPTPSRNH